MKRWPAFSLIEISIVLLITGIILMNVPVLVRFYKAHEAKQQIEKGFKVLGAYVAVHSELPKPEGLRSDDANTLRGIFPYETLGMLRTGVPIRYTVKQSLTENNAMSPIFSAKGPLNRFANYTTFENNPIALELSAGSITIGMSRNAFLAQYGGMTLTDIGKAQGGKYHS